MLQSDAGPTGYRSCSANQKEGERRDRSEEMRMWPPRLLGTKFIPISNREFISGERYENQFPSDISVIRVFAQQSEWDHSKKQSHSWTGMRQFGAWIDPDTGHLIQKLLYPTLFPPPTPIHTTIHALQMTRFKNSILYSIFLNRIMFKLS